MTDSTDNETSEPPTRAAFQTRPRRVTPQMRPQKGPDLKSDQDDQPETFPREYVENLRQENGRYRQRAQQADAYAERLHTELVRATGRLADPTDLPFDAEHLATPTPWSQPIDDLLARKPHLATRKPVRGHRSGRPGSADAPLCCSIYSSRYLIPLGSTLGVGPGGPARSTSWRRVDCTLNPLCVRTSFMAIEVTSDNSTLIQSQVASCSSSRSNKPDVPGRRPGRARHLEPGPGAARRQRCHRRVRRRRCPDQ